MRSSPLAGLTVRCAMKNREISLMTNDHRIGRRAFLAGAAALPFLMSAAPAIAEVSPNITVTKDPSCGCCSGWIDHLTSAGFAVQVVESAEVELLKRRLGVPPELWSCHTAEIEGYVVEGHVPVAAIRRLMAERPAAIGLAVPGMPSGSPGMDFPGVAEEPYEVHLFRQNGDEIYGRYLGTREI